LKEILYHEFSPLCIDWILLHLTTLRWEQLQLCASELSLTANIPIAFKVLRLSMIAEVGDDPANFVRVCRWIIYSNDSYDIFNESILA